MQQVTKAQKIIRVDKELHKRLKLEAIERGITLKELIEELIKNHYDTTY